jgi:hypothetical protein
VQLEGYLTPAAITHIHGVKENALGFRSSSHHRVTELEDIQIVKELGQNVITELGIALPICVDVITFLGRGPIGARSMVHRESVISYSFSVPSATVNSGGGLLLRS